MCSLSTQESIESNEEISPRSSAVAYRTYCIRLKTRGSYPKIIMYAIAGSFEKVSPARANVCGCENKPRQNSFCMRWTRGL